MTSRITTFGWPSIHDSLFVRERHILRMSPSVSPSTIGARLKKYALSAAKAFFSNECFGDQAQQGKLQASLSAYNKIIYKIGNTCRLFPIPILCNYYKYVKKAL